MDPSENISELASTSLCQCTLQSAIIFTAALVLVIAIIKIYFRGGRFNIPQIDLSGKYAVVTGGNSGIGAWTVKQLTKLGCSVIIGARNKQTAQEVIKQIRRDTPTAKVQFIQLDLANRNSIQSFAKSVTFPQIDYLVNNAGIMEIPQRKTTKEGVEMQWGINHLGHFYLTYLLWSKITASPFFRITNVSSLAHKKLVGFGPEPKPDWKNIDFETDYNSSISYSRSKLYNVLFTKALSEKIGKRGLTASLHPGVVRTDLMREMESDGIKGKILQIALFIFYPVWWLLSKSSWEGNQTTMFTLLSDKVESGEYFADCKKSMMSSQVTSQNCTKLWQISQEKLGIKFTI